MSIMTTPSIDAFGPEVTRPSRSHPGRRPRRWPLALIRSIASTVATVVMTLLAVASIVLAVASHLSPRGEFEVFGHPTLSVLSGSMTPAIRTGDLVIDDPVTPAQASSLRVGQIITFRVNGNQVFTHRIVRVVHDSDGAVAYVTKGDANNAPDSPPRPASSVVGLYRTRIPYGGYVLNALRTPLVLVLLGMSLLLAFTAAPLFRWARSSDAPAEKDPALRVGTADADPAEATSAASITSPAEP